MTPAPRDTDYAHPNASGLQFARYRSPADDWWEEAGYAETAGAIVGVLRVAGETQCTFIWRGRIYRRTWEAALSDSVLVREAGRFARAVVEAAP